MSPSFTFASFDVPGATFTAPLGINNSGNVVGQYGDASGAAHGFLHASGGSFTTIDFPGSGGSEADGINNSGQVVGAYRLSSSPGVQHSFLFSGGNFTSFDVPGDAPGTTPAVRLGINDAGQIVGGYRDAAGQTHGFLRDVNGSITVIDAPGFPGTKAAGINNVAQIVGSVGDFVSGSHGFVRDAAGAFTTFGAPGARFTDALGINDFGQVVGGFLDATGRHGFLRDPGGGTSVIDVPGATSTDVLGINNFGVIAGSFRDAGGNLHGFVGSAAPLPDPIRRAKPCDTPEGRQRVNAQVAFFTAIAAAATTEAVVAVPPTQLAVRFGLLIFQALLLGGAYVIKKMCDDPFDPNFTSRFDPQFVSLPRVPEDPSFPPSFAEKSNRVLERGGRALSYLQATEVSLNRYFSAVASGDNSSADLQTRAVDHFLNRSADELDAFGDGLRDLASRVQGTSLDVAITLDNVKAFLSDLQNRGVGALPAQERDVLQLFSINPAAMLSSLNPASIDPTSVPLSLSSALNAGADAAGQLAEDLEG